MYVPKEILNCIGSFVYDPDKAKMEFILDRHGEITKIVMRCNTFMQPYAIFMHQTRQRIIERNRFWRLKVPTLEYDWTENYFQWVF